MNNSNGSLGLGAARRRFEAWRRSKGRGRRIPEELWETAVESAREHGVSKTAQELGVGYYSLKERMKKGPARRPRPKRAKSASATTTKPEPESMEFLEIPEKVLSSGPVSVVELQDAGGLRLRVELRRADAAGVESLARALWSQGR